MGWRGFLRSLGAASRAAERERRRRVNATARANDRIDRIITRMDAEFERDMEKLAVLEQKICTKPISASGIQYDPAVDHWHLKNISDETGQIRWSAQFSFASDLVRFGIPVDNGNRIYRLLAISVRKWAVYAAFEISTGTSDAKCTKLFNKSDPTQNKAFLIASGFRYQAMEGGLDSPLFGPHPTVALVAFPVPQVPAKNVSIELFPNSGTVSISVAFENEDVFQKAVVSTGLAQSVRNKLASEMATYKDEAQKTKQLGKVRTADKVIYLLIGILVYLVALQLASRFIMWGSLAVVVIAGIVLFNQKKRFNQRLKAGVLMVMGFISFGLSVSKLDTILNNSNTGGEYIKEKRDDKRQALHTKQLNEKRPVHVKPDSPIPTYDVVGCETSDVPIKTQIELHAVVSGTITEIGLEQLLDQLYNEANANCDFKYNEGKPTHVFIYLYTSREHFESGAAQWIAMLSRIGEGSRIDTQVKTELIADLNAKPEVKHGFPESKRKEIFKAIVAAEDRADVDAERMYPLPDPCKPGYSQAKANEQFNKQVDVHNTLTEKYKSEVAQRYVITKDQLRDIGVEGITKNWPLPKRIYLNAKSDALKRKQAQEERTKTGDTVLDAKRQDLPTKPQPKACSTQENSKLLLDFTKIEYESDLITWSGPDNRIWFTSEGIKIQDDLTTHPPKSLLTIQQQLSGDFIVRTKVKMEPCEFRIFIDQYFFIFGWFCSNGKEHHLRTTRDVSVKTRMCYNKPELKPNVWHKFTFIIKGSKCKILVQSEVSADCYGKEVEIAELNGREITNGVVQIGTAHNRKIIIQSLEIEIIHKRIEEFQNNTETKPVQLELDSSTSKK